VSDLLTREAEEWRDRALRAEAALAEAVEDRARADAAYSRISREVCGCVTSEHELTSEIRDLVRRARPHPVLVPYVVAR